MGVRGGDEVLQHDLTCDTVASNGQTGRVWFGTTRTHPCT